eukprot:CAMPEP_0114366816 /NCGR_PEP_ID=MMETSP0101-20121206/29588_1 /TAXON_ID=38822 ORGANISM="Pteridomonas danica, Strain PT" /NCGR_SAMPLE_ID=MMETSP0101 /ASSEMBLY_ACC=CAM_ASM_000211 /LENGTH=204 /DNA_ID=CAMNT_0001516123 /DNA_START=215 /DNA_END=826 /DNA_ORIENTATION=+
MNWHSAQKAALIKLIVKLHATTGSRVGLIIVPETLNIFEYCTEDMGFDDFFRTVAALLTIKQKRNTTDAPVSITEAFAQFTSESKDPVTTVVESVLDSFKDVIDEDILDKVRDRYDEEVVSVRTQFIGLNNCELIQEFEKMFIKYGNHETTKQSTLDNLNYDGTLESASDFDNQSDDGYMATGIDELSSSSEIEITEHKKDKKW